MKADLNKLKELSKNNKNFEEIVQTIESLHDRQDYAKYHYQEYLKLSNTNENVESILLAISTDDEFIKRRLAIKANIMACIHNMHIIHDYLGYLIFYTLNLEIKGKIDFYKVLEYLKSLKDYRHKTLLSLLFKFKCENNTQFSPFKYLCDISNHSKHKFIIESKATTNLNNKKFNRNSKFFGFTQKNNDYKEMDIDTFIKKEYEREAKLIIEIENELISILENT